METGVETTARLRDIYRTAVVADVRDRLVEVACRMRDEDVDALIVMDGTGLAGIITDRELVEALADGVDLQQAHTGEFMSPHLVQVDQDASIQQAMRVLADANARHLVISAAGSLVGIISARDLLRAGA